MLGDRRRVGVVLDQHRALEGAAQPLAEAQPRPLGQRGPQPDRAVRLDDPRRGDAHGPQRAARDPRPAQQFGHRGAQPFQALVRRGRLVYVLGLRADDPAVQVGQERGHAVRPDLHPQQMPGLGPEPEPPRGPPLPPLHALVSRLLDDVTGLDEPLDDTFDGRPGQSGHPGDLGQRRAVGGAQRVQHHRGIDPSQQRGIPAGQPPQRPSSQLVRVLAGSYSARRTPASAGTPERASRSRRPDPAGRPSGSRTASRRSATGPPTRSGQPGATNPDSYAAITACVRSRAPSFASTALT